MTSETVGHDMRRSCASAFFFFFYLFLHSRLLESFYLRRPLIFVSSTRVASPHEAKVCCDERGLRSKYNVARLGSLLVVLGWQAN